MQDGSDSSPGWATMAQARKLLAQGLHQESLALAMEALAQELDRLREALQSLQALTRAHLPALAPRVGEEASRPESFRLSPVNPRLVH